MISVRRRAQALDILVRRQRSRLWIEQATCPTSRRERLRGRAPATTKTCTSGAQFPDSSRGRQAARFWASETGSPGTPVLGRRATSLHIPPGVGGRGRQASGRERMRVAATDSTAPRLAGRPSAVPLVHVHRAGAPRSWVRKAHHGGGGRLGKMHWLSQIHPARVGNGPTHLRVDGLGANLGDEDRLRSLTPQVSHDDPENLEVKHRRPGASAWPGTTRGDQGS